MRTLTLLGMGMLLVLFLLQCFPSSAPESQPIPTPKEEPIAPSPTQAPTEQPFTPIPTPKEEPAIPWLSPTPAPVTPTPIPHDVADIAYFDCGVEAWNKLVDLTLEIGLAPLTDTITCLDLQRWEDISEGIRLQHGNCPVPKSRRLLAARDSLEGALDETAECLFYHSEYCQSPSGGAEYVDACLDAVLEAQLHMNESRIAFEAFLAGGSDAEEATPGYAKYTNLQLRFSAEYPDGWDVEGGNYPASGPPVWGSIAFLAPGPEGENPSGLAVMVRMRAEAPLLPFEGLPTDEEYIDFMNDVVDEMQDEMQIEIVVEPSIIEVDGYKRSK